MADLFSTTPTGPLAEQLRPRTLSDVVGQAHLLGPGKPLRLAYDAGKLHSCVFWGPPGVGKTTLARILAKTLGYEFITLSAVLAGAKEIRMAADAAQHILDQRGQVTVLFMDEIHRLNAAQQDLLLPHVESGLFVLLSATTANPSFALSSALLSRAQVYVLEPLEAQDFATLYIRAQQHLAEKPLAIEAVTLLAGFADGDARRFLNLLEQVWTAAAGSNETPVSLAFVQSAVSPSLRRFDTDDAYALLSAFHKSVRGSSPDGALYWMARLLDGKGDALAVARRMIAIATEDIGIADPRALQIALHAAEAYERLGAAEGERALAQAAVYLALAPKSNALYQAWNAARAFVRETGSMPVPLHLRNAPTGLMQELGYKKDYRYAHHEPHAYAAGEHYLPEGMATPHWYQPVERGLEIKLREKLEYLAALDEAARTP